jgi:branched-chain amino acid transport system ATP-binding protein
MLETRNLSKVFGGIAAVNDVSLRFEAGKINAIIGPNGAGKSTFFNLVSGLHPPSAGQILFDGTDVTGLPADVMAARGIARTFQTTSLFDQGTVTDNLLLGCRLRMRSRLWDVVLRSRRLRDEERQAARKVQEILEFIGLSGVADRLAGSLSQEQRKRVAVGLALATEPRMMLLDEPAGGISEEETANLGQLIRRLVERGLTVGLIEHKMTMIMSLADRIVVLDHGSVIAAGTPAAVQRDERVIEAYLGAQHAAA